MTQSVKPREWTLFYRSTGYSGYILAEEFGHRLETNQYPRKYQVIEKAEYDRVLAELEALKEERADLVLRVVSKGKSELKLEAENEVLAISSHGLNLTNAKLEADNKNILELLQNHAEGGNIENYSYLTDKIEALKDTKE